jgi:hypothetical protein
VPYFSDNQNYERVSGSFEHEGEVYRLLKQKYSGDTLTIVCVKDPEAAKINRVLADYVKTFTDRPLSEKHSGGKTLLSLIKDYMTSKICVESQSSGWKSPVTFLERELFFSSFSPARIKYPPKV